PVVAFAGRDVARIADAEALEEVLELRALADRTGQVGMVRLHVDDEVVGLEQLARGCRVARRAVVDREPAAAVLGVAAAVDQVDRHQGGRGAGGRLQELAPRPAELPRALVGHRDDQPFDEALARRLRWRIELAVRDELARDRQPGLVVVAYLAGRTHPHGLAPPDVVRPLYSAGRGL